MPRRARPRLPAVPTALGALTVGAVAVAVTVVGSSTATGAQERTVTVTRGVVQSTVSGSGNLSPANQQELSFGTSGDVVKVYVREGQHVHEGQLLARLDDSSAQVDLAQANADLQSARDTLTSAQTTATASAAPTTPTRGGGNASSDTNSNQSTTTPEAAQAAVDSAELAVKSAETALAATRLRAPMPATVAAVNGAVGDTVGSSSSSSGATGDGGSTSGFITLAQLSRYRMDVALSESDIGKVKVGQPATVTVNASGDEFAGRVTKIGVLSSSSSSSSSSNGGSGSDGSSAVSYPVTITLDQTGSKLKAGMSASADIVTSQASGITAPTQALQGSTVTLLRNGKRVVQAVQTGVAGDSTTQILSGLKVGDQVVVRSSSAVAGAAAGTADGNQRGRGGLPGAGGFGGGGLGGGGANFRTFRGGGP